MAAAAGGYGCRRRRPWHNGQLQRYYRGGYRTGISSESVSRTNWSRRRARCRCLS